jgi:hypothetical protein
MTDNGAAILAEETPANYPKNAQPAQISADSQGHQVSRGN